MKYLKAFLHSGREAWNRWGFLFQQLVRRDFQEKYKRTILGMGWSVLSPLLTLLIMRLVFTRFFGRTTPHYTTYLFCGTLVMSFFRDGTTSGMGSLVNNSGILTKIDIPKYLFLFSKNVSSLVNFGLTLVVFFLFCAIDRIPFSPKMLLLIYPTLCVLLMNIGVGMVLSALYVFFQDIAYFYGIFLTLLTYLSAIFYTVDQYGPVGRKLFLLNPVYVNIKYFREIVINGTVPSPQYHLLCAAYALIAVLIGTRIYRRYNYEFIYYL